jgi:D-alanyl-D-alanine carboxypeptidase/D-alanyl-D-alanine-endopeptidase (penicillin-binding protein 4)
MKLKIIFFLLLLTGGSFCQQGLQNKLDSLFSDSFFKSTLCAVDVYDLTAGKPLYQLNNRMLLHPASNMKIITSAAALIYLKKDSVLKTDVSFTGNINNGVLSGNIFVTGGLDPVLSGSDLDTVISILKLKGISQIKGDLVADVSMCDSLYWGKGWMWDDNPTPDVPYMSSLNINENTVSVSVVGEKTGEKPEVLLEPSIGYFKVINNGISDDKSAAGNIKINREWINGENTIIINGSIKTGEIRNARVNVVNPANYFLAVLKDKLIKAGIAVKGKTVIGGCPADRKNIFTIKHEPDSILVWLNKTSDNLSAEMFLRLLSVNYYGKPANAENGITILDSLIIKAGFNPSDYRIVDGSGLSHYNLVSAELLSGILKYIYYADPASYSKLYNSFPVAGVDGTLRDRMIGTAAYNNVHAKTGTLSGISCLSGYVTAANGNLVAFSIMMQNHVNNYSKVIFFQNQACDILANYR